MKKTNTKKGSSPEKSSVPAKNSQAKKTSSPKKTNTKTPVSAKKTVSVASKSPVQKKEVVVAQKTTQKKSQVTPVVKTTSKKPVKKTSKPVVKSPESSKKNISQPVKSQSQWKEKEGVKMLGILHLAGNILSGWTLGVILVGAYLLLKKAELSQLEKETCYEIINFNISFIIYTGVLAISVLGIVLIPVLILVWLVLIISWFMAHLRGENYKYPLILRLVS